MPAYLAVGDTLTFDGKQGTVVVTTATLDANGRGSLTFEGNTFQFRFLKETGTPTPLVATSDAYLRIGLLQQTDNALLFVLVFDDLPAPGCGRWIQGASGWAEASSYMAQDSVTFVTDWKPGTITVSVGGVPAAGVFCDVVYTHSTSDGTQDSWHAPAYPYNGLKVVDGVPIRDTATKLGSFKTDANGVLWACRPDGTLEPITFPRYFAALGQRASDTWPSMPEAERLLTKAEVWYLQEHVEITEGASATLDVAAVSITINGPPGANVNIMWEDGILRPTDPMTQPALDGAGTVTVSGLPPGDYVVALYHASNIRNWLPMQSVAGETGGSYTLDFGGTWNEVALGKLEGRVRKSTGEGAAGAVIMHYDYLTTPPVFPEWEVIATCDADGYFGPINSPFSQVPEDVVAYHPDWGCQCYDPLAQFIGGGYWDVQLAGPFGAVGSASNPPMFPEGIAPWAGIAGIHVNLPCRGRMAYVQDETSGEKFYFRQAGGGVVTDPAPRARWTAGQGLDTYWELRSYSLYDADGTLLQSGLYVGFSVTPVWCQDGYMRRRTATGTILSEVLGGKINGVVAEYAPQTLTEGVLREPERYGLETGKRTSPLEVRSRSETVEAALAGASLALCLCEVECSYCGGPAWTSPDAEGYQRGYCVQCADYGVSTDCRTYFSTRTLGAHPDWSTRIAKNTTAGGHVDRLVTGWPRPEEYDETDAYLVSNWQGLGIPRWVAVHLVLGSLAGGVFTDGESIADAEARLGRTVGACQLKLVLTSQYLGTGKTVWVTATRADNGESQVLTTVIPPNSPVGTIVLLRPCPHHKYPSPSWFTDVTAAAEVSGDGYLACQIVNDGSSWRSSGGVIVVHGAYASFACDVLLQEWEPECRTDYMGRAHVVYNREGMLYHRIWQVGQQAWGEAICLTQRANWVTTCAHHAFEIVGPVMLVTCESGGERVWFQSTDSYGETWSYRSGTVAFSGLTNVQTTVDYMGRVWGVGLDTNGLLTAECTPDLGVTGYYRNTVEPSAADSEQPGLCIAGSTFILVTSQGGSLRTWVSKRGGEHWEQAPVVE